MSSKNRSKGDSRRSSSRRGSKRNSRGKKRICFCRESVSESGVLPVDSATELGCRYITWQQERLHR